MSTTTTTTTSTTIRQLWKRTTYHARQVTCNVGAKKGGTLVSFCPDSDCGCTHHRYVDDLESVAN